MNQSIWNITLKIFRKKEGSESYFQKFSVEIKPDEYVLDAVEKVWAFQDRSLTFRHLCHHSTCGACGMLVNGVEKLTCITSIESVTTDGGEITIEPLRNFPIISDLVVDMGQFYRRMEEVKASQVLENQYACLPYELKNEDKETFEHERLSDCIECGLCISACPSAATSNVYLGPAVMAAAHQNFVKSGQKDDLINIDSEFGVWRCHSAYECTEVCPSNVDPAWRIMDSRKNLLRFKVRSIFGLEKKA